VEVVADDVAGTAVAAGLALAVVVGVAADPLSPQEAASMAMAARPTMIDLLGPGFDMPES